jgi:hypothetical protein
MSRTKRRYGAKIARLKSEAEDPNSGQNRHCMHVYGYMWWDDRGLRRFNKLGRDGRYHSPIYVEGWKERIKSPSARRYYKRQVHVDRRRKEDHEMIQEGLDSCSPSQ